MKNFKVIIKTDREDCPYRYIPYCAKTRSLCRANNLKLCTEKNRPLKECMV